MSCTLELVFYSNICILQSVQLLQYKSSQETAKTMLQFMATEISRPKREKGRDWKSNIIEPLHYLLDCQYNCAERDVVISRYLRELCSLVAIAGHPFQCSSMAGMHCNRFYLSSDDVLVFRLWCMLRENIKLLKQRMCCGKNIINRVQSLGKNQLILFIVVTCGGEQVHAWSVGVDDDLYGSYVHQDASRIFCFPLSPSVIN